MEKPFSYLAPLQGESRVPWGSSRTLDSTGSQRVSFPPRGPSSGVGRVVSCFHRPACADCLISAFLLGSCTADHMLSKCRMEWQRMARLWESKELEHSKATTSWWIQGLWGEMANSDGTKLNPTKLSNRNSDMLSVFQSQFKTRWENFDGGP